MIKREDYDDMDAFIDAALREEPLRDTPFGFRARFEDRLRFTVALQRERARFRNCLVGAAALFVFLGICVGLTLGSGQVVSRVAASIPGALGYYDYMSSAVVAWGPEAFAVGALLTVMMAWGIVAVETSRGRAIGAV